MQEQDKQADKQPNADAIDYTRGVLFKWFEEEVYFSSHIELEELDKLSAWLAAYCINRNNPDVMDRPRQCLWICGACGRGKTMLARILSKKLELPIRDADDISAALANDSMTAYDRRLLSSPDKDLIIDDIGAEELRGSYGNTTEFPRLLTKLYELWRYCGKLLIVTSNYGLSGDWLTDLNARYGERVTDRLVEMFLPIRLTGRNWRRDNG